MTGETAARRRIRQAAERNGLTIEPDGIDWQPIGPNVEMVGNEGGWTVFLTNGEVACGYNQSEVIARLDDIGQFGRTDAP